jgi:hypothetical protein
MLDSVAITVLGITIALNALVMLYTIPFAKKDKKHQIMYDITYSLVWEADRVWESSTGHVRRAYVKAKLYVIASGMPLLRNYVLKEEYVEQTIDEALQRMNQYRSEQNKRTRR